MLENEKLQLELQRGERQYIIGQLAASVAHEVRNPMTVVHGFLQLLHESNGEESISEHKHFLKIMLTELERAHVIINDYLSLAKPQAEKIENLNIVEEVAVITETLNPFALLKGVSIKTDLKKSSFIKGNQGGFRQVLINIIKNGIEATTSGGTLNIQTFCDNERVYIKISDNGIGMSNDQLKDLGLPFYSLKEKGTGLGLTVCYSIVKAMGGKIEVESKLNLGTTFTLSFPQLNELYNYQK